MLATPTSRLLFTQRLHFIGSRVHGPARCLSAMPVPHFIICEVSAGTYAARGSRQKYAWIADSVHTSLRWSAQVTSAIADRAALHDVHRQGSCGRGHVPTLGPQQWQVNHACADGHAAALSACL